MAFKRNTRKHPPFFFLLPLLILKPNKTHGIKEAEARWSAGWGPDHSLEVCLLCRPWAAHRPSTGSAGELLIPTVAGSLSLHIGMAVSFFSDKPQSVLKLLVKWPWWLYFIFMLGFVMLLFLDVIWKKINNQKSPPKKSQWHKQQQQGRKRWGGGKNPPRRSLYYPAGSILQLLWKCSQAYWCRRNQSGSRVVQYGWSRKLHT